MKINIKWRIGCSGFYNRHWKTIFYPEKLPQSKWLNFYSEEFNTVELNTTFYRFPTAEDLYTWYKKSPDHFQFSVKAPRIITHLKKFNDCKQLLADFYLACQQGMKEKLGGVLFQFPPSVHFNEEKLKLIIEELDPAFRNVVEFRHPSWWNEYVYNELTKKNIIFCTVNHPDLPQTTIVNNETLYVRLHGNPTIFYSDYDNDFLDNLYKSILEIPTIKEVYVYFNNTASNSGVLNALELKKLVQQPSLQEQK